ncbi:hypothetical protein NB550_12215 [Vibrio parahaemolyticus]|uniref:hypothetical protein n=1 Tax=Vibrio parahaemolyticus TaxID=670 RepID=UPI00215D5996|nr:hypothetical protein [Vibrio parahaemolyticus]MCR9918259.1 hypothetical protein [Vibrio parahaemolyticus]
MTMVIQQTIPANLEEVKDSAEKRQHRRRKNFAFKSWQHRLKRGDTLPQGKFFRNKIAGAPIMILDECGFYFNCKLNEDTLKLVG